MAKDDQIAGNNQPVPPEEKVALNLSIERVSLSDSYYRADEKFSELDHVIVSGSKDGKSRIISDNLESSFKTDWGAMVQATEKPERFENWAEWSKWAPVSEAAARSSESQAVVDTLSDHVKVLRARAELARQRYEAHEREAVHRKSGFLVAAGLGVSTIVSAVIVYALG